MRTLPAPLADFLAGKRIVVVGVSRTGRAAANAIFRRLRQCGYEAVPVNPHATQLEGARCYPGLSSVPGCGARGGRRPASVRGRQPRARGGSS